MRREPCTWTRIYCAKLHRHGEPTSSWFLRPATTIASPRRIHTLNFTPEFTESPFRPFHQFLASRPTSHLACCSTPTRLHTDALSPGGRKTSSVLRNCVTNCAEVFWASCALCRVAPLPVSSCDRPGSAVHSPDRCLPSPWQPAFSSSYRRRAGPYATPRPSLQPRRSSSCTTRFRAAGGK